MARPTSSTAIGRPDLKAEVMEFDEKGTNFIADLVLPDFPVDNQSGKYPVIPVEALTEAPDDISRRPRGGYKRGDFEFEMDSFDCTEFGWEEPVDDVEVRLYSRYFDVEKIAAIRARAIVKRVREKRVAALLFNASNFSATSITHEWDDATNAVPITDVQTGRRAIHDAIGIEPNTLIIAYSTFHNLGLVAQIIDRIKYTHPDVEKGEISKKLLAMAFGVEQVVVGDAMKNTAKKGQDASLSAIWYNEYAMLCHVSRSPDITTPCIGRTFRWTQDCPENQMVETYRDETLRSDIVRVREHCDEEIIIAASAYLMDNITTI